MGVSHHSPEYDDMKAEIREEIADWLSNPDSVVDDLVRSLFSVMSNYGAVEWT